MTTPCRHSDGVTCAPAFLNTYRCVCGCEWEDEWSCGCDDECPECGTCMTPVSSEEIAECACDYL